MLSLWTLLLVIGVTEAWPSSLRVGYWFRLQQTDTVAPVICVMMVKYITCSCVKLLGVWTHGCLFFLHQSEYK